MLICSLIPNHEALVQAYVNHYTQTGRGQLPAFQGTLYQEGAGLGDILRSFFRTVFPIVAPAASSFLGSALTGWNQGKSLKDAAVGAIRPAATMLVDATAQKLAQKGSGRKRKRASGGSKKRRGKKRKLTQSKKSVYKGVVRGGLRRRKSKRTKVSFIPTNF